MVHTYQREVSRLRIFSVRDERVLRQVIQLHFVLMEQLYESHINKHNKYNKNKNNNTSNIISIINNINKGKC